MLKKLLMCLLGSIAAYLAAALLLGNFTVHASRSSDMGDINIFLLSNGVHTDIVLPVKHDAHDWRDIFPRPTLPTRSPPNWRNTSASAGAANASIWKRAHGRICAPQWHGKP